VDHVCAFLEALRSTAPLPRVAQTDSASVAYLLPRFDVSEAALDIASISPLVSPSALARFSLPLRSLTPTESGRTSCGSAHQAARNELAECWNYLLLCSRAPAVTRPLCACVMHACAIRGQPEETPADESCSSWESHVQAVHQMLSCLC
jgi:hypothetical protein